MSAISKRGIKSNPAKGRPFSLFELLGDKQTKEAVKERYAKAVELLKTETIGVFTNKNGFDPKRFDKWTAAQKRKVRRYYTVVASLQQHGVRVKTAAPRDPKKRATAQKVARHPGLLGKLKYVYTPGHPDYNPTVVIDSRGHAFIRDKYFDTFSVYFSRGSLATDDEDDIYDECVRVWDKMLRMAGTKRRFQFATVITGESESFSIGRNLKSAEDLFDAITELFDKYDKTAHLWARGINGYFSRPGAKVSQTLGSRSAIHANDLDEKNLIVKKIRRVDPETRDMYRRRVKKETSFAVELSEAYKKLDDLERTKAELELRGTPFKDATYKHIRGELEARIKGYEDKLLARSRHNKRTKK